MIGTTPGLIKVPKGAVFIRVKGWKKSFRQIYSPPEEELHPEPAVPGIVGAEEDLGGAGECWECYKVLAHICTWPALLFFSELKSI